MSHRSRRKHVPYYNQVKRIFSIVLIKSRIFFFIKSVHMQITYMRAHYPIY